MIAVLQVADHDGLTSSRYSVE